MMLVSLETASCYLTVDDRDFLKHEVPRMYGSTINWALR
jgi:hypothetical protein